jgi:hypothetical protein
MVWQIVVIYEGLALVVLLLVLLLVYLFLDLGGVGHRGSGVAWVA